MLYEISSGNSPAECELAATKLAEHIKRKYAAKFINSSKGYNKGTYRSITLSSTEDLSEFIGSVL